MQPFHHHAHLLNGGVNNTTPLDRLSVIHPDDVDDSPTFALLSNFPVHNTASLAGPSTGSTANSHIPHHGGGHSADQATQQDNFDTQLDGSDPLTSSDIPPTDPAKPWARLVSKDNTMNNYELMTIPEDEKSRFNLYSIGRSSLNSIRFDYSPRISNQHCIIYCKQNLAFDRNRPFLEAFIEDLSANGTFVNNTRLTKNTPRQLHNADVIALINPKLPSTPETNTTTQDVDRCSFIVTLELFNPMLRQPKKATRSMQKSIGGDGSGSGSTASSSSSSQSMVGIGRSNTVIRLLTQKRSIFDFYEFRELLGQGGVAAVHLGIKKDTGSPWAIKIIDTRQFQLAEGGIDTLTREAEMLRSLRHPNIIHLEDIFADGDKLYLVMELSHGGDLFERIISKHHYEESLAKEAMKNILSALAYLHSLNIAHRDLKPENILLSKKESDTEVKISDFGLAKVASDSQRLKTYCGTPQYFAPEVLQRKNTVAAQGSYSLAADMWSMGIILFVMLAGEFPFDDPTKRGVNAMRHSFAKPAWSRVSDEAKDLINKLLVKDPSDRLNAEQALKHPWFTGQPYELSNAAAIEPVVSKPKAGRGRKAGGVDQPVRPPVPTAFFPPTSNSMATSIAVGGLPESGTKRRSNDGDESLDIAAVEESLPQQEPVRSPSKRTRRNNSVTVGSPGESKEGNVESGSGKSSAGAASTPSRSTRKKPAETTPMKNSMDKFVVKK